MKNKFLLATSVMAVCFASSGAFAQSALDPSADAARAGQELREQLQLRPAQNNIQIQEIELLGAPEGAEDINLVLNSVEIEGNTAYSAEELAEVYADQLGQTITLAELYRIANAITLKYRNDGYILTQVVIPPQTIESGDVKIQVVEGYVGSLNVQAPSESESAKAQIIDYANQINTEEALNIANLERYLLLINDLPGITARTIISPSQTPGAADLLLIIERKAYDAQLSFDNFGSRFLGEYSLSGVATLNSILGLNEAITAQFAFAPGTGYELLFGSLRYEQPVGPYGTRVGSIYSKTTTDAGFTLETFDARGQSDYFSVYTTHPIVRSRDHNLTGRLLFDWRDVENTNNIPDPRSDSIRAVRAGLDYTFTEDLIGLAVNNIDIEIAQGLDLFGASSDNGDADLTRPDGDPQFLKAELDVQRLQRLTNSLNLQISGQGQLSNNPLLSSEEFGVGGFFSGRGYDPSEIVGEDGIAGQFELQWNDPLDVQIPNVSRTQVYTFYDVGRVWNQDATTAADKRSSLASSGFGLRLDLPNDFETEAAVAFPLTRDVESEGDDDTRFYFNLNKRF